MQGILFLFFFLATRGLGRSNADESVCWASSQVDHNLEPVSQKKKKENVDYAQCKVTS